MPRVFLCLSVAVGLALSSCATFEGWFESGSGFEVVRNQAQAIVGVQARFADSAENLGDAIGTALDDPAGASLKFGDELDVLLDRFAGGADELGRKRNRLRELGERMQEHWSEYALLLPEGHPWRDAEGAADEQERMRSLMSEIDSRLASTQSAMAGATAQLRPAVSQLRKAGGKGQIESQREVLEAALQTLRDLPAMIEDDAELLRAFADEFVNP